MAEETGVAWPIADEALSQQLLDLVQQATNYRQVKKGANEYVHPLYNMLPESCFIALSLSLHEKMVANLFFLPGPPRP
jgi:U4/U6 small nuclear ribonucleoprotein SNU13